eukprot:2590707-Pyramimonas_sp.AAC.1
MHRKLQHRLRTAKGAQSRVEEGPTTAHEAPKTAQESPQTAPRRSPQGTFSSLRPQDAPSLLQEHPKRP